jgi:O-acetyl-ADP-ribose deacetylase (regulator of RNase III)
MSELRVWREKMGIKTIPSLVVGLGGTGKRALTHLKRRIYDTYGVEELPWIRLLSLDADSAGVNNPPVISQRSNEFINLGNNEMRIIDQSDTPQVISHLEAPENSHILDWYPDPDMKVDFPKAARGSGQVRMFGRIGLYKGDNLHTTYRWLQQAAYEVSDPAAWEGFGDFDVDPTLQFVYIVSSLCGGTGSGMFLDVAYMLRKIVGVDPSTRRFIGMFVLPEVYEPVVENAHIKRIYANSYAALRELDFLMNSPKRSYTVRGKDHTFVDFPRDVTPFDFVFLFSNKNRKGAVISQRQVSGDKPVAIDDRVSQYMSETVMTDILSPVTERSESILSNIFSSLTEPEQMGERTFYKTYSAVGVSSVKVPSIDYFEELIELRLTDAVLEFLLRPDPDVTEKALAREFYNEFIGNMDDRLVFKGSLSNDPSYTRFLSKAFREELKQNRQAQAHRLSQWIETALSKKIDSENCLESEQPETLAARAALDKIHEAFCATLARYAKDPERGFIFISEWVQELVQLVNSRLAQTPLLPVVEGDPQRPVREALESFKKIGSDFQLPLVRDTLSVLIDRVADYYDERGRNERSLALSVWFYKGVLLQLGMLSENLQVLVESLEKTNKTSIDEFNKRVAAMGDTSQERVLIDKPLIGRREIELFLDGLLAALWENNAWKDVVPVFSAETKKLIQNGLSSTILEIQLDRKADSDSKREAIRALIKDFVRKHLFNRLFPVDPNSGRRKEPPYTTPEGKSLLLDFAGENLMQLLVAHSVPLWFVHTHKLGSASQPFTFVGLNGSKLPDNVVDMLKKHLPNFRPTDIVLSSAEARILVKQYDPLYSLASLAAIGDYENYYKNTDRKSNPMHTDLKFAEEPNQYLQWLSYKSLEDEAIEEEAAARAAAEKAEHERVLAERIAAGREAVDRAHAEREAAEKARDEAVKSMKSSGQNLKVSATNLQTGPQVMRQSQSQALTGAEPDRDEKLKPAAPVIAAVLPAEARGILPKPHEILNGMNLVLRDRNPDVVKAWQAYFSRLGEGAKVEISEGDLLEAAPGVIVVPVNSFGILDSGLALALNKKMEGELETLVRKTIMEKYAGEMPIGSATALKTGHDSPGLVIITPTMRVPASIMAVNVNPYLSTRAALLALSAYLGRLEEEEAAELLCASVSMSGLGTGAGRSSPATAAFQMYEAYCQVALGQLPNFATIEAAMAHDQELKKNRFV